MSTFRFTRTAILLRKTLLTGHTIYGSETLQGQIADLLKQPYTDSRLDDIPRRLQAYFKGRGYYDVNVEANGAPDQAVNGRVPVEIYNHGGPGLPFRRRERERLAAAEPEFCVETIYRFAWENV